PPGVRAARRAGAGARPGARLLRWRSIPHATGQRAGWRTGRSAVLLADAARDRAGRSRARGGAVARRRLCLLVLRGRDRGLHRRGAVPAVLPRSLDPIDRAPLTPADAAARPGAGRRDLVPSDECAVLR